MLVPVVKHNGGQGKGQMDMGNWEWSFVLLWLAPDSCDKTKGAKCLSTEIRNQLRRKDEFFFFFAN